MLSHPVKHIRIHNDRPITQDAVQWQICHAHNTIELILPEYPEVRVGTHMTRAIQAQTGSANVPILPIPSCHRYPASSEGKCQTFFLLRAPFGQYGPVARGSVKQVRMRKNGLKRKIVFSSVGQISTQPQDAL